MNELSPTPREDDSGAVEIRFIPEQSTPGERMKKALDDEEVITSLEKLREYLKTTHHLATAGELSELTSRLLRRIEEGSQRLKMHRDKPGQDGKA